MLSEFKTISSEAQRDCLLLLREAAEDAARGMSNSTVHSEDGNNCGSKHAEDKAFSKALCC
jgi:hypothetical protein